MVSAELCADPLDGAFTADWLMGQSFPPTQFVVGGIIPEGLTMLVAAPKIGKSWMVLGLALAASNGTEAFGCIPTQKAPVLYLALEDGPSRLQSRMRILGATEVSSRLVFMTSLPTAGPLAVIDAFMDRHRGEHPIVVLDTLGKVMVPAMQGESQYERDYRVIGMLKRITDAHPGSSVIVVHHTRKAAGVDFLDAVSGTQGIAGAADHILLLKRPRNEMEGTLQVTSRDAPEGEYLLEMRGTGNWALVGGSAAEAARAVQENRITGGVGDRMAEIIATVGRHPEGIEPKSIKALLPDIEPASVDTYLKRAHESGRIQKLGRGKYAPIPQTPIYPLLEV